MNPSRAEISRMIGSAIFEPSSLSRRFSKNVLAFATVSRVTSSML